MSKSSEAVDAALELMSQAGPEAVSFREVARKMGCAHTNLYNYFTEANALLQACAYEALLRMSRTSLHRLSRIANKERRLQCFYRRILRFHLDNPGWFRLIWLSDVRAPDDDEARKFVEDRVTELIDALQDSLPVRLSREVTHDILHIVHCYMHGEITIFLAGKSLIRERKAFERYVSETSVQLTGLLAASKKHH